MNAREFAAIILKMAILWWLISGVLLIPSMLAALFHSADDRFFSPPDLLSSVIFAAVFMVVGLLLFLMADPISRWLAGRNAGNEQSLSPPRLQAIAFSVLGVYLAGTSLPRVMGFSAASADRTPDFVIQTLVQFILGIALFFAGPSLARAWHRRQRL